MNGLLNALRYGAIGLAAILAMLAYLLLRAEQKKEKPKASILRMIRLFMLFALVIALAGLAAEVATKRLSPEQSVAMDSARQACPVLVEKFGRPAPLEKDTYAVLLDIETLKGKPKKDDDGVQRGGHTFNKGLWKREAVITKILSVAQPVPSKTPEQILTMSDEEWVAYLSQQDDRRKRQVLDTPFARIRISRGPNLISERWYFQDERLDLAPGTNASWRVAHVFNTDAESGQKEAVIVAPIAPTK